uniref:Rhomboid-like protein n=1 Tax=Triticum urartu TaxID=4572 RepID=A0A8R7VAJ2_TRIUA
LTASPLGPSPFLTTSPPQASTDGTLTLTQRQQRRGWLARRHVRACFDARRPVELAGGGEGGNTGPGQGGGAVRADQAPLLRQGARRGGDGRRERLHQVKCCSWWSCASGALFGLLGAMLSELFINWAIYTNKVGASPTNSAAVAVPAVLRSENPSSFYGIWLTLLKLYALEFVILCTTSGLLHDFVLPDARVEPAPPC